MPTTPPNGGHRGAPIEYWERPPYGEKYNQDDGETTRTCLVDWHHARDFPAAMLGDVACAGRGRLKRFLPDLHPHTSKQLWATECQLVNGLGAWTLSPANDLIFFNDLVNQLPGKAEFKVTYRQRPYAVLPDTVLEDPEYPELHRWVIKEYKINIESYQLPGVAFAWKTKRVNRPVELIPEGMAQQRAIIELTYTWVWVPEPINTAMFDIVGKVNEFRFPIEGGAECPAHHLLCLPPTISERKWTPRGTPVRNITYHLAWRIDSSWNQFYRASTNRFEDVITRRHALGKEPDPHNRQVYQDADFGPLFEC